MERKTVFWLGLVAMILLGAIGYHVDSPAIDDIRDMFEAPYLAAVIMAAAWILTFYLNGRVKKLMLSNPFRRGDELWYGLHNLVLGVIVINGILNLMIFVIDVTIPFVSLILYAAIMAVILSLEPAPLSETQGAMSIWWNGLQIVIILITAGSLNNGVRMFLVPQALRLSFAVYVLVFSLLTWTTAALLAYWTRSGFRLPWRMLLCVGMSILAIGGLAAIFPKIEVGWAMLLMSGVIYGYFLTPISLKD